MQVLINAIIEDAAFLKNRVLELIADNSVDVCVKDKLLTISVGLGQIEEAAKRLPHRRDG